MLLSNVLSLNNLSNKLKNIKLEKNKTTKYPDNFIQLNTGFKCTHKSKLRQDLNYYKHPKFAKKSIFQKGKTDYPWTPIRI